MYPQQKSTCVLVCVGSPDRIAFIHKATVNCDKLLTLKMQYIYCEPHRVVSIWYTHTLTVAMCALVDFVNYAQTIETATC